MTKKAATRLEELELEIWIASSLARVLRIALGNGTYDSRDFEGTVYLLTKTLSSTDKELKELVEDLTERRATWA